MCIQLNDERDQMGCSVASNEQRGYRQNDGFYSFHRSKILVLIRPRRDGRGYLLKAELKKQKTE